MNPAFIGLPTAYTQIILSGLYAVYAKVNLNFARQWTPQNLLHASLSVSLFTYALSTLFMSLRWFETPYAEYFHVVGSIFRHLTLLELSGGLLFILALILATTQSAIYPGTSWDGFIVYGLGGLWFFYLLAGVITPNVFCLLGWPEKIGRVVEYGSIVGMFGAVGTLCAAAGINIWYKARESDTLFITVPPLIDRLKPFLRGTLYGVLISFLIAGLGVLTSFDFFSSERECFYSVPDNPPLFMVDTSALLSVPLAGAGLCFSYTRATVVPEASGSR